MVLALVALFVPVLALAASFVLVLALVLVLSYGVLRLRVLIPLTSVLNGLVLHLQLPWSSNLVYVDA